MQAVLARIYRLPKRPLGSSAIRGPMRTGPTNGPREVLGLSGPPLGYASEANHVSVLCSTEWDSVLCMNCKTLHIVQGFGFDCTGPSSI